MKNHVSTARLGGLPVRYRMTGMLLALFSVALLAPPPAHADRDGGHDGNRSHYGDRTGPGDRGARDGGHGDARSFQSRDGVRVDNRQEIHREVRRDYRYESSHRGVVVRSLPSRHRTIVYGGRPYHYYDGYWYRPMGDRFVVVLPPVGIVIPTLPFGYVTLTIGGNPYYTYGGVYYAPYSTGGYVVVDPPQGAPDNDVAVATRDDLFIYPKLGQSEKKQASDRYECHEWASGQTGYDPTMSHGGVPEDRADATRADYLRAMTACLEGRGYTVR